MAHNVDDWLHALQQVMPQGKLWPRDLNAGLTKFLRAFAARLSRAESDADGLINEMRPESATQLLTDWEEYLGLPECQPLPATITARRRFAAEKHNRKGGLAAWQIEEVAATLGFHVKVNVFLPHHCMRNCMQPLYPSRYRWLLQIEVLDHIAGRFTCIDNVMTPLLSERARELECVMGRYRLSGTGYEYIYAGEN